MERAEWTLTVLLCLYDASVVSQIDDDVFDFKSDFYIIIDQCWIVTRCVSAGAAACPPSVCVASLQVLPASVQTRAH